MATQKTLDLAEKQIVESAEWAIDLFNAEIKSGSWGIIWSTQFGRWEFLNSRRCCITSAVLLKTNTYDSRGHWYSVAEALGLEVEVVANIVAGFDSLEAGPGLRKGHSAFTSKRNLEYTLGQALYTKYCGNKPWT